MGKSDELVVEEKYGYFMLDLLYYQFNLAMNSEEATEDVEAIADT